MSPTVGFSWQSARRSDAHHADYRACGASSASACDRSRGERGGVGQRIAVAEQAEAQPPVVAEHRDRERATARQRDHRVDGAQLAAEHAVGACWGPGTLATTTSKPALARPPAGPRRRPSRRREAVARAQLLALRRRAPRRAGRRARGDLGVAAPRVGAAERERREGGEQLAAAAPATGTSARSTSPCGILAARAQVVAQARRRAAARTTSLTVPPSAPSRPARAARSASSSASRRSGPLAAASGEGRRRRRVLGARRQRRARRATGLARAAQRVGQQRPACAGAGEGARASPARARSREERGERGRRRRARRGS